LYARNLGGFALTQHSDEVNEYLQNQKPDRKAALETVRRLIFETIPQTTETMRYRMPTYEIDDVVCALASQKQYMSLYMDTSLVEKYRQELAGIDVGKSCIRFKRLEDLPLETVRKILIETVENQVRLKKQ
jgi:uncharacterized protein YdhG (YjbR/CyaY superfamily)